MSFEVEVTVMGEPCWDYISMRRRFATREEAEASAKSLFRRFAILNKWRVVESEDAVDHEFKDGRDVRLSEVSA